MDSKCINAKNEISTYHYKEDKDGNAMRIPIDKNNDLIDAARYAYESDMEYKPSLEDLVGFVE